MPFNLGPSELFLMMPFMLLLYALPIGAAIWALLTLARMRRLLEQIDGRIDTLAERLDALLELRR